MQHHTENPTRRLCHVEDVKYFIHIRRETGRLLLLRLPVTCGKVASHACRRVIASILPSVFPRMHSSGHRSQTTSPSHSSHTARMNLAAPGSSSVLGVMFGLSRISGDKRMKREQGQRWLPTARQKPSRGADQGGTSPNGEVSRDVLLTICLY